MFRMYQCADIGTGGPEVKWAVQGEPWTDGEARGQMLIMDERTQRIRHSDRVVDSA